jgi:hypothetical protein
MHATLLPKLFGTYIDIQSPITIGTKFASSRVLRTDDLGYITQHGYLHSTNIAQTLCQGAGSMVQVMARYFHLRKRFNDSWGIDTCGEFLSDDRSQWFLGGMVTLMYSNNHCTERQQRYVTWSYIPVKDDDGKPQGLLNPSVDTSNRVMVISEVNLFHNLEIRFFRHILIFNRNTPKLSATPFDILSTKVGEGANVFGLTQCDWPNMNTTSGFGQPQTQSAFETNNTGSFGQPAQTSSIFVQTLNKGGLGTATSGFGQTNSGSGRYSNFACCDRTSNTWQGNNSSSFVSDETSAAVNKETLKPAYAPFRETSGTGKEMGTFMMVNYSLA